MTLMLNCDLKHISATYCAYSSSGSLVTSNIFLFDCRNIDLAYVTTHCRKKMSKTKKECIVMSFQVVAMTAAKCTKMKNARSKRAKLLFLFSFLKMQICDVLVVTVLMFARSNRLQIYRFICRHMK